MFTLQNQKLKTPISFPIQGNESEGEKSFSYQCLKLPPCDTEVFKGDYMSWPSFRDMFQAVYFNHPKLGAVEKLFHLRAKTSGEAHKVVSKFPLTNASFDLAWEALRSQYENKRILVNNQIKILLNLPGFKDEASSAIRTLQRNINDCRSALEIQGISTDNWDPILVFVCANRLPPTTLALWEQSLSKPTEIPTWEEMNKFLSNRYQVLESILDTSSSSSPRMTSKQTTSTPVNSYSRKQNHINLFHTKTKDYVCM